MGSWQWAVGRKKVLSAECGVLSEERKWAVGGGLGNRGCRSYRTGGSIVGEGEVRILLQNVFYRDVMYQYKA